MKNYSIVLSLFVLGSIATLHAQVSGIDSTLNAIQALYDNGMFISSELEARRTLEQNHVSDSVKILLEKHIAFSLVAQGKNQSAGEHFNNILQLDAAFDLDPLLTSPKILSVFHDAKLQFLSRQQKKQTEKNILPISTVIPSVTYRVMIFPGWEQLHQNRTTAGYVFLGAGAATLGSTILFDVLRRDARASYLSAATSSDAKEKYATYNAYHRAEIASAMLFGAVYVLSELDAFVFLPQHSLPEVSLSDTNNRILFTFSWNF